MTSTLTLLLTSGATVTLPRDRVAYPRLRDQVAAYEASTGNTVRIAG